VEQIIEEEHAREMSDTLTIIRDVVHIADDIVVRHADMTKEEIVQEVMRIAGIGRPALTYQIARRRRGHRHGRQQG
jgi:predicted ArsR family transcriptional regulator